MRPITPDVTTSYSPHEMSTGYDDASTSAEAKTTATPTSTAPCDEAALESIVDLDALRGWSESQDPALRKPHRLPDLARLDELDGHGTSHTYAVRNPDVLIGRSHFRHPPVDISLHRLQDFQLYRLGTPHAQLFLDDDGWKLRVLTLRCPTQINGRSICDEDPPQLVRDGDELVLGVTRFRFSTTETSLGKWQRCRRQFLKNIDEPALLLERHGAPCGPHRRLSSNTPLVVGRTHPAPGVVTDTMDWPEADPHFWDLSGLYDHERTYLAFRHASVEHDGNGWTLRSLSTGHQLFVNGDALSEPTQLQPGDRIGVGSVTLRFYDPATAWHSLWTAAIPEIVDWSGGRAPDSPLSEPE